MGGGETRREVELKQSRANRKGVLETFADDEISAPGARPEADGMAMKLPKDPLRVLDRGQTAGGGGVEIGARAASDLAPPIVRDLRQQGRGGSVRRIRPVLAVAQEDLRVIAERWTEARDPAPPCK